MVAGAATFPGDDGVVALERPTTTDARPRALGARPPEALVLPRQSTTTTLPPTTSTVAPPNPLATAPLPAPTAPPATGAPTPRSAAKGALCIGDSVMLGASPQYHDTLTMCRVVDATVSRQFRQSDDTLRAYAARNELGSLVVVHLGTNGPVTAQEFDDLMRVLRGVERVVIVNVQLNGTRAWEGPVNAELARGVARYDNCVLADWNGASRGRRDWFGSDRIHLTPAGAQGYSGVIGAATS